MAKTARAKKRQKTIWNENGQYKRVKAGKITWSEVNGDRDSAYECWNADGEYLGFIGEWDAAEHMVKMGFVNVATINCHDNQIDLWEFWNNIFEWDGSYRLMESTDGLSQVQAFGAGFGYLYLVATFEEDGHTDLVEVMDGNELYTRFGSVAGHDDSILTLRVCQASEFRRCE